MLVLVVGIFVWLLGLCVGSFLNVVVYRLPAGLSINKPARSFCPRCGEAIAWYDNIPVLSWWLLGARCRRCAAPISVQYPLVEAVTGLTFVVVYYLLVAADARVGANQLTYSHDWPLLLMWLVLAAALIACSAMDLVSYMVDVRITYAAMAAGLVCHAAWPRAEFFAARAHTPIVAASVAVCLVSLLMLWLTVWRVADGEEPAAEQPRPAGAASADTGRAATTGGRIAVVVLTVLTLWLLAEAGLHRHAAGAATSPLLPDNIAVYDGAAAGLAPKFVVPAALLAVFAAVVLVGGQPREADAQVKAAIEEEQPQARKIAGRELLWLLPAIVAGGITYLAVVHVPAAGSAWNTLVNWSPGGGFCPLAGVAFAAFGAFVGAAAGWTLRIVFTLVFGREALGIGDIYILAAAGAAGGWDIALLGLILAVGAAIAGYTLSLLLKRSLIIPFGPWLAIGFVAALWLNKPAAAVAREYYHGVAVAWADRPDICAVAGGLMLVGSAVAVALAHVVRRLVEPPAQ